MPSNVGVLGLSLYFPRYVVKQEELEAVDGVKGKYTIGLGQEAMCFCSDREDVVSMAKTVTLQLLERYGVDPVCIGKLAVGTETGVDRSKSVMSYLMEDFGKMGNPYIQGCDHTHACYGGTAALLAAINWVYSPSWDGRLALVVAADIAVYKEGSAARPTGGCGAAALLVGPNAPLVLEPYPWQAHYSSHTFDFFKPHGHPCYPVVDGPASTYWFVRAAEGGATRMYQQLLQQQQQQRQGQGSQHQPRQQQQVTQRDQQEQQQQRRRKDIQQGEQQQAEEEGVEGAGYHQQLQQEERRDPCKHQGQHQQHQQQQQQQEHSRQQQQQQCCACSSGSSTGLLSHFDYFLSHAPFNKLVRKVFARLLLQDALRRHLNTALDLDQLNPTAVAAGRAADAPATGAAAATEEAPAPGGTLLPNTQADSHSSSSATPSSNPSACTVQHGQPTSSSTSLSASNSCQRCRPGLPPLPPELAAAAAAEAWDPDQLSATSLNSNKQLEHASLALAEPLHQAMVSPGAVLQRQLGNLYTASLYSGLAQLVSERGKALQGKRLLMYSFGSGAVASLFVLRGRGREELKAQQREQQGQRQEQQVEKQDQQGQEQPKEQEKGEHQEEGEPKWSLEQMARQLWLEELLSQRLFKGPAFYAAATDGLVKAYGAAPYTPAGAVEDLAPGTVYLTYVDEKFHRFYDRVPA